MPQDGRPYFSPMELARRIKAARPQLAEIPDDRLVAFWTAKFPKVKEQLYDPAPAAKIGPAPAGQTAGEPDFADLENITARYEDPNKSLVEGAGKAVGTVAKNVTDWIPGLQGVSDAIPDMSYENPAEAKAGGAVNAAMMMLPSGAARVTGAKSLEKLPWVRAQIAAALEGGKAGGLTAAQGGDAQESALMGLVGGAAGWAGALPREYIEWAKQNVVRMVRAAKSRAQGVRDVAEKALQEGGLVGTLGSISQKVDDRLEDALAAKGVADELPIPVPTSKARQGLQERAGEVSFADELPQRHPNLTDTVLDEYDKAPPHYRRIILQSQGATEADVKIAKALRDAPTTGDPASLSALREEEKAIEALSTLYPAGIPYPIMAKYRAGRGQVARRGGAYDARALPGNSPTPDAAAAKAAAGEMTPEMHLMNPSAKRADDAVHVYTTLKTSLDNAGLMKMTDVTENRFLEYLTWRVMAGAAIGGYTGQKQGDLVYGTLAGAAGGAFMTSSFWHSLSGTAKYKLAKAIQSGNYEKGVRLLEAAAANWQTQNRLPRAPEE